jgi:gluconokinase
VPDELFCYSIDRARALLGGALNEGGSVVEWARRTLSLGGMELDSALATRLPDAHGLTVLPFLSGERSPSWRGDLRGTIHGLGLDTDAQDILQALMESVAYRLAEVLEALERVTPVGRIVASGGAATAEWLQVIADVFERQVDLLAPPEVTSRGVAILLREMLRLEGDLEPPEVARALQPNPDHAATYRAARARQSALDSRLHGD